MNFASINLNLLVVFDAIMSQRSLTRAGQALGLSQPAISHALGQLRHMLDDPLFVRARGEMRPTARAREIAGPLHAALEQINASLTQALPFDPLKHDLCLRIGMTDYTAFTLLGRITDRVRSISPRCRIQVRAVTPATFGDMLENQDIDLCIASAGFSDNVNESEVLFFEHWVCARSAGRSAGEDVISLADYLSADHLVIGEEMVNHVDRLLAQRQLKRRNVIGMPFCLVAPTLAEQTDVMVTLPMRVATGFASRSSIALYHVPFETRGFPVRLAWSRRHGSDPAIAWLRGVILEVCKDTTFARELEPAQRGSRIWPRQVPALQPARPRAGRAKVNAAA
jgi:DNA-binding transcriptional LysR family regulator